MSNTTQNNATKTYDVHTTGFGYLNQIREVTPKNGGNPYLSCNITLQEGVAKDGDFSKINKIYFQANIVGRKAIELIREHFTNANGEVKSPEAPVTASVRLGGIYAELFTYDEKHEKAGQKGIALKTRLLKINWMAVGGDEIEIPDGATESETDSADADEVEEAAADGSQPADVSAEDTQPVAVATATSRVNQEGARTVRLEKDDPEFDAKKSKLKELGYQWDKENQHWFLLPQTSESTTTKVAA